MSIADRSRRRVEAALDRLRADHGDPQVVDDEWARPPAAYDRIRQRFEAGTVGGAGVWLRNDAGEVLLVREAGAETWSEPSGKHEPGERLAETARREVREETNVECTVTGVELAQRVTIVAPDRPPLHRLVVVFGGEYVAGTPRPAEGEIDAVRWWDRRPSALAYDSLEGLPIPAAD